MAQNSTPQMNMMMSAAIETIRDLHSVFALTGVGSNREITTRELHKLQDAYQCVAEHGNPRAVMDEIPSVAWDFVVVGMRSKAEGIERMIDARKSKS